MPKKTRKEKIRTKQHRQYFKNEPAATVNNLSVDEKKPLENVSKATPEIQLSQEEKDITHYFKTDLRKSLIIIAGIFALEFFFYFATMNNYLAHYLNF